MRVLRTASSVWLFDEQLKKFIRIASPENPQWVHPNVQYHYGWEAYEEITFINDGERVLVTYPIKEGVPGQRTLWSGQILDDSDNWHRATAG